MFGRYKKVSSLCLGTPTAVSWSFGYEDYGERRVFANKFNSVFTEFRNKWKIGGRLFKELSRTMNGASQAIYYLAASMSICALRWSPAWNLTILYKVWSWTLMWSGRKKQLNKTDVHMAWRWSAWLFPHPHDPTFYRRLFDCDCCWSSNSSPPATRSFMPT